MLKLAVLGSPISHSLSPEIHSEAYRILGIDADYGRFQVDEASLDSFVKTHSDWSGFSLTMPLKEKGLELCSEVSKAVKVIGALNTLVAKSGNWHGYNTDVMGFDFLFSNKDLSSVAILGAGGTAKAALYALSVKGVGAKVYRRNSNRDDALLRINSKVEILAFERAESAFDSSLLINALPKGAFETSLKVKKAKGDVLDSIYNPWPTPLNASADSSRYFSGKDLLVAQAIYQIELFTGLQLDIGELFPKLRAVI